MDSNTPSRPLRFHPDGSFKLLQVTDVQETTRMRPETLTLLNAVLDRARPDLVVLTGDQVRAMTRGIDTAPMPSDARLPPSANPLWSARSPLLSPLATTTPRWV